jgi:hypothetical protein
LGISLAVDLSLASREGICSYRVLLSASLGL